MRSQPDLSPFDDSKIAAWCEAVAKRGAAAIAAADGGAKGDAVEAARRAMRYYHMSLSPREFPLKIGQWAKVAKVGGVL